MAKSHRMTPKRRAALRKAQLASARKRRKGGPVKRKSNRRRNIGIAATVGTAAVLGTAISYRIYDAKVEKAQHAHLQYKAWNTRVNKLDVEFDDDILHASMLKPHKQPRRYSRRPLSQQTKFSIHAHRKKSVFGRAINAADRVATAKAPIQVSSSFKYHKRKQTGPGFEHVRFGSSNINRTSVHVFGARVGNARASLSIRPRLKGQRIR